MIGLGEAAASARPVTDDAMGPHQPLHPLVIDRPAASAQLGVHSWRAVGAIGAGVDAADLADEAGIVLLALGGSLGGEA
jgi:hypothetical protein